jgi:hypothetical protein
MSWDWFAAHLGCSWPQIFEGYQKECGIFLDAALGLREFNRAYRDGIDTLCEIEIVADVARRHFGKVPMAVASGGTREIVEATLLAINLFDLFEARSKTCRGEASLPRICSWTRLGDYACLPISVRSLRTAMRASRLPAALG